MTSEVEQAQRELIEEFSIFDDWMDRYQYLIDLGRRLPPLPPEDQVPENKLSGCQSQVWMTAREEDGRMRYRAISDAAIVSGLIALLLRIYDNRRPQDIVESEPAFIEALGLDAHLSPTRANGLGAMLRAIRGYAAAEAA